MNHYGKGATTVRETLFKIELTGESCGKICMIVKAGPEESLS